MSARLRIACVVSFLDEQEHLPAFLDSLERQQRFPDLLLLIDDGSSDRSPAIAAAFAEHRERVRALRRARRASSRDRLAGAAELRSFHWGLSQIHEPWDVVAKMDADLVLCEDLFETMEQSFLRTPGLGIAGAYLSLRNPHSGRTVRERCPPQHVRGATKFYRRACLAQISPIPPILGWDTIDELAARRQGWATGSIPCSGGDVIHLRPTGGRDGLVRAQYRWGRSAYGIGQHPVWVALSAARRLADRPFALGSLAFVSGWASAALRRQRRAAPDVRAFARSEELSLIRRRARRMLAA
jgi:glycosyltransferase involved in cell wall biosynthesis